MMTVHLYRADFLAMLNLLSRICTGQFDLPLQQQPISVVVLMTYQSQLSLARIYAWESRRSDRPYKFNMPIPVVVTLFNELYGKPVSVYEQELLNRLIEAFDNYKKLSQHPVLTTTPFHVATR